MGSLRNGVVPVLVIAGIAAVAAVVGAGGHAPHSDKSKPGTEPPATIRITMDELHAQGGVPHGWKFLMPPGVATEGRKVFVTMECFACHEVKGEHLPHEPKTSRGAGPELTGMGSHHPGEYFAESILNPNRVVVEGPGYTGADGLSKMPSYADTMTLKQLVDLVAYLESLTTGEMEHGRHGMGDSGKTGGSMKMK